MADVPEAKGTARVNGGWNPVVGKSCEQSLRETSAWMKAHSNSAMSVDIAWALAEIDRLREAVK